MADANPQNNGSNPINLRGNVQAGSQAAASNLQASLKKFDIPQFVKDNYPDLIPLIIETESMNDDERQYWFSILPIMTTEQINKLREILLNEKTQLQKLDSDYAKELKRINDKHLAEWKGFEMKEKWSKIKKAEAAAEEEEKQNEEEILKKLQEL